MLPPLDTPGCAGRRTCNVNLDDLRWDRPDIDCEPQQARGIRRNLQLDETVVVGAVGAIWVGLIMVAGAAVADGFEPGGGRPGVSF